MRRLFLFWTSLLFLAGQVSAQKALPLSGDFQGTHDPSIAKEGGTWYVFATGKALGGGQLSIRCSTNLKNWHFCGQVFDSIPDWIRQASPMTKDLWAPDIAHVQGEWRLYYAYSLFGKNTSGIAMATNRTLDPQSPDYRWIDKGLVLRSVAEDQFNAIDPNYVEDFKGRSWLTFGSFWGGIQLRRLNADGMPASDDTKLYPLARRSSGHAVEAPFLVHHGRYYYLFVSWDICCRGAKSTYRTMVGRATDITGPYLDREGKSMLEGGGTELLTGSAAWVGPGGASAWTSEAPNLLVFHAYDAVTGRPALQISTIDWMNEWPRVALADVSH